MKLILEKFAGVKAPRQAQDVQRLVGDEAGWLEEARPSTARRYSGKNVDALRNILRVVLDPTIDAYIIRDEASKVAHGLATIILGVTITHPSRVVGSRSGNELDYWLRLGTDGRSHIEVAEALIRESAKPGYAAELAALDPTNHGQPYLRSGVYSVLATVQEGLTNPPIGLMGAEAGGFSHKLDPLGEPAELTLTRPDTDRHGILESGKLSQLYYGTGVVFE